MASSVGENAVRAIRSQKMQNTAPHRYVTGMTSTGREVLSRERVIWRTDERHGTHSSRLVRQRLRSNLRFPGEIGLEKIKTGKRCHHFDRACGLHQTIGAMRDDQEPVDACGRHPHGNFVKRHGRTRQRFFKRRRQLRPSGERQEKRPQSGTQFENC